MCQSNLTIDIPRKEVGPQNKTVSVGLRDIGAVVGKTSEALG